MDLAGNPYLFLFFSAMSSGAAFSLFIRILMAENRRETGSVVSPLILFLLFIAIILIPAGLVLNAGASPDLKSISVFYLPVFAYSSLLSYFLKKFTIPVTILLLAAAFILLPRGLTGFSPVRGSGEIVLSVLQVNETGIVLEIREPAAASEFIALEENSPIPQISALTVSPYLFMLPQRSFYRVEGLGEKSPGSHLPFFLKPFAEIETVSLPPLKSDVMYSITVSLKGSISFQENE